jgi:MarR family transcriptional regulator, lower aerobic nicotinate degradation pathway regulator
MKQKSSSPLQEDAQNILDAIRKIVKALRDTSKLAEKSMGLSAAQLFVLQKIAESDEPLSINELATRTLTHQSSVSVVVTKLVNQKCIERVASKKDGRSVELYLSKKGAALVRRTPLLIQQRLLEGISALTTQQRQGLVAGIQLLVEKAGLQQEEPSLFFEDEKN